MLANRPGMTRIVPELTHGVPCPGRGSFCHGNVKIDHRAWIYGCSLMSVLYSVLCLSVTHDLTCLACNVTDWWDRHYTSSGKHLLLRVLGLHEDYTLTWGKPSPSPFTSLDHEPWNGCSQYGSVQRRPTHTFWYPTMLRRFCYCIFYLVSLDSVAI